MSPTCFRAISKNILLRNLCNMATCCINAVNVVLRIGVIGLIKSYQLLISPILRPACRYTPSCSHYALSALRKYGIIRGLFLTARRLLRCHPWGGSGYDPVP